MAGVNLRKRLTIFESMKAVIFRYVRYVVNELRLWKKDFVLVDAVDSVFECQLCAAAFLVCCEDSTWKEKTKTVSQVSGLSQPRASHLLRRKLPKLLGETIKIPPDISISEIIYHEDR